MLATKALEDCINPAILARLPTLLGYCSLSNGFLSLRLIEGASSILHPECHDDVAVYYL